MLRSRPLLLAGLAITAVLACDRVTPVAPAGSTITLSINPTRISARGETAKITAIVRKEDGTRVNPGTQVNFSTTLGQLEPTVATTDEAGVALAQLTGDGRIGIATVTATTGAAAAVTVDVQIGSAASSITLNATPTDVAKSPPAGGEVIRLVALVRDDTGAPLPDVTVNFEADIGTLTKLVDITDANGQARDELTVNRNNISVLFEPFFEVRAQAAIEGGSLIEDIVEIQIRGVASTITLQATPTTVATGGGTIDLFSLVRDNLGDPLEGAAVNFFTDLGRLDSGGSAIFTDAAGEARDTLVVAPADTAGLAGRTFSVGVETAGFAGEVLDQSVEIRIQSLVPVAVFTVTKGSADGRTVNFTFTGTGEQPLTFAWDFNLADGDSTLPTGSPPVVTPDSSQQNPPFTYTVDGAKTVKLVVSNAFGSDSATASFTIPLP